MNEVVLFTIDGDLHFDWHAHRLRSLVTDVTPTGMHAYDGHSNTLWLCHEQGCLYWNLHCVLHVDSHQRASFLYNTLATIINGLICVGLVYPSSYPVDSIYKGTPVITSKNKITIMFMIPSNKRLVR